LLKTGRTQIHTSRTAASLGTEIEASVGTVFEVAFGEFSVGGRPYRGEGTAACCGHKYRGVDFSKAIQLSDLAHFSRQQICGTVGCCK
jgi:hypothetical protein